jgi:FkbM family methyltransferase
MSAVSKYFKLRYPSLYSTLVGFINKIVSASRPYTIYITDNLGGSFKSYFIENNMPLKINALKKNLDTASIELVEIIIQRLLFYPDGKYKSRTSKKEAVIGGLLPIETKSQQKIIGQQLRALAKSVKLPSHLIEESVFYFYHGLSLLPKEIHEYIREQHFIDIGAYIGDSAIALSKYQYSKIYSLEISLKSIDRYRLNMKENNIPIEKYKILNIGVAPSDNEPPIKMYDTGSAGFSLYRRAGKYDEIQIERKSLDWIVDQNGIQPKFIKIDIEGAAMDFVKGASKTLTKFRPVLSIAIYHNPTEFFEVKPALDILLTDYMFLVRKLASGIKNNLNHSEVVLLAYPMELLTGT